MKRLSFVFILLLCALCVYASYTPSLSFHGRPVLTKDNSGMSTGKVQVSGAFGAELNPLSFSFGNNSHRISVPVDFEYVTKSNTVARSRLMSSVRGAVGLRYQYRFNSGFSIGADTFLGYSYYRTLMAGNIFVRFDVVPSYCINKWFSLGLPVGVSLQKGQTDFTVSLVASFRLEKEPRKRLSE